MVESPPFPASNDLLSADSVPLQPTPADRSRLGRRNRDTDTTKSARNESTGLGQLSAFGDPPVQLLNSPRSEASSRSKSCTTSIGRIVR